LEDFFDYLWSPSGKALVSALACTIFLGLIWSSMRKQEINLGSVPPKIQESKNPRLFWSVIFFYGLISAWMGVSAVLQLKR